MMKVKFGSFHLEIDPHRTAAFYETMKNAACRCACLNCKNYECAADTLSDEVIEFFTSIGVNIKKPIEIYVNHINSDGTLCYCGFYHLCGTMPDAENKQQKEYPLSDEFFIQFENTCDDMEDGFPTPAIQLNIRANLPWMLEEK